MALGKPINPGVWAQTDFSSFQWLPENIGSLPEDQVAPDTADLSVLPPALPGEDGDDAEADDCLARHVFGMSSLAGFSSYEQEQAEEGLINLVFGLSPQAGYPYPNHQMGDRLEWAMGHEHVVPLPGQRRLPTRTRNGEFLKRKFNRNVRENVSTSLPYAPTAWPLVGTWRLTTFDAVYVSDPSQRKKQMGDQPNGLLVYSPDGYMSALMTSSDPEVHLPKAGYAGKWTVEDDRVHHHVETSTQDAWVGTTLSRKIELKGQELLLTTLDSYGPEGQKFIVEAGWKRAEP
ncbi:hypothetical protein BDZ90DRAFT_261669 [Jaminaea rosea]|uniref:Lipocalin-like domain-containing protein n=1 Tax=Jaminaea rosea TaxID=1569628 RepID=A0A316UMB3_9BASI|nr:hypothetical protein BDZ90DRAFT_261669 [Jaminaea rosea]PWN26360.1 hypothetical protein BDZ90DRAFT_261669 [Jaminaea rosea]